MITTDTSGERDGLVSPQNLAAEAAVLSAALNADDARIDLLGALTPEDFYSTANRLIFTAMRELSEAASAVDLVTVQGWLLSHGRLEQAGGSRYLVQIADATPAVANYLDHATLVVEKRRVRTMIRMLQRAAAEGYGTVGAPQEWLESVEARVSDIVHVESSVGLRPMRDVGMEAFEQVRCAAEHDGAVGTSTGFPDLDRILGGLMDGDFYVLAARPGMGKTALALELANRVATPTVNGTTELPGAAAVFSLEMNATQLGLRMLANEARVDARQCRSGHVRREWWPLLTDAVEALSRRPLFVDDTAAISMREISARAARLARAIAVGASPVPAKRLSLVVIDYLQLLGGEHRKDQNREQFVSEQSAACKRLAKELGVAVLALSQLNRSVEQRGEKRPTLPDLRESGAIEQDADAVLFLYRDDYYHRESSSAPGQAEVIVAKQRNGPTGTATLRFTEASTRFDSLARERGTNYDPADDDY